MEQHGTFPIVLQKEKEGGYSVTNLALEGCYSQGETVEEALANIKEATLLCLEDEKSSVLENEDVSLHLITV
jgi:predicted RNase H-like HicB family nuclease